MRVLVVLVKFIHEDVILSTWDINLIKIKRPISLFTYNAIKTDFVNLLNSSIKCHRHTSKKHGADRPACINFVILGQNLHANMTTYH